MKYYYHIYTTGLGEVTFNTLVEAKKLIHPELKAILELTIDSGGIWIKIIGV